METQTPANCGFKVGDRVVRRAGTLGNMDGDAVRRGDVGTILAIGKPGHHTVLRVKFPGDREENFVWHTYSLA